MPISPEDAATMAADKAATAAQWEQLRADQQKEFGIQRAEAEAGIYQTMGFHKIEGAAENADFFLQTFAQTTNKREEASLAGEFGPPSDTGVGMLVGDSGNNHWDVIGAGFGNTDKNKDPTSDPTGNIGV